MNSTNTIPNDILLNGGSIPTMNSFSDIDDDILIYDSNSLFTSLTRAQTQPILSFFASREFEWCDRSYC
ncbi:hypothetical protein [Microcoleus sp. S13_C5]|uniref:hypothetical protein n=1 Tax=Microcoleus sp. S13_C5 TaxID=3055411 RepID=UPI002FD1C5B6